MMSGNKQRRRLQRMIYQSKAAHSRTFTKVPEHAQARATKERSSTSLCSPGSLFWGNATLLNQHPPCATYRLAQRTTKSWPGGRISCQCFQVPCRRWCCLTCTGLSHIHRARLGTAASPSSGSALGSDSSSRNNQINTSQCLLATCPNA